MLSTQPHNSPWLHYLARNREALELKENIKTNIAVIGAGIAGISTAYFLLENTDVEHVIIIEAGRVAHGASGHNGGFLATYLERSFRDLVSQYGLELASKGQRDLDTAWDLLDEMAARAELKVPIHKFTGYTGIQTREQVIGFLEDNHLKDLGGVTIEPILISEHVPWLEQIPSKYDPYYALASHEDILDLLESKDDSYVALLQSRKGATNSAVLCDELANWLLDNYQGRFQIYEHSKIEEVILEEGSVKLLSKDDYSVSADKVVLCTNGFEKFTITNKFGEEVNNKFHYLVRGIIGYMAGYLEESVVPPIEVSYLPVNNTHPKPDIFEDEAYFYLTRRPVEHDNKEHTLVCLGGPEELVEDTSWYHHKLPYSDLALDQFNKFLKKTYDMKPKDKLEYQFLWHGLMGFTPNGVRLIGPEPYNPVMLYNLGCNGVGLLPSIYGGRKIASFINNEELEPSIFDPKK